MRPERWRREGPRGELAAPRVIPIPPQGHVQAAVPMRILQPRLVEQAAYQQAHRQGEAFLGLSRPDLTRVVNQDCRIP